MDTEQMNRALDMIEQLAQKLGVTVEYLWPEIVRSVVVNGVVKVCFLSLGAIVAWSIAIASLRVAYKTKFENDPVLIVVVGFVTIALFASAALFSEGAGAITQIFAPVGPALQTLGAGR